MVRGWAFGLAVMLVALATFPSAVAAPAAPDEGPYLAQTDAAMARMMTDMAIKPTGDVDRDFVDMMVPHHQGAVDMAQAVLRYGHNEAIRRMAQEIIVTQQEEIAAMRRAVGEPAPPSSTAPTQGAAPRQTPMPAGMEMK